MLLFLLSLVWVPLIYFGPLLRRVHAQNWTATVLDKHSDASGNEVVALHFADDLGHTYDVNDMIPFGAPATQLGDFVRDIIAQLTNQKAVMTAAPAVGVVVVPTATTQPTVDQNAAIKATFQADYLKLKQCQTAISRTVIPLLSLDPICATLPTKVQGEFAANESILLPLVDVGP